MAFNTDVDIDVADRDKVLDLFKHVPAKLTDDKKHKTGVYFHNVPTDYLNGTCAIDYKQADSLGFFKLDVINNSAYKDIDPTKLEKLISKEPNWDLLLEEKGRSYVDRFGAVVPSKLAAQEASHRSTAMSCLHKLQAALE